MLVPPVNIIRKQVCPEHLCNLLDSTRLLERVRAGELRMIDEPPTLKKNPRADYHGNWLTHNQETRITDRRFMDERRIAAKLHRHLTVTGRAGASGKYDPKTITLPDGTKYQPSDPPGSTCELCESGDMIFPWRRFRDSKYKPSAWRCLWIRFRGKM
jgi:hypothetical protein